MSKTSCPISREHFRLKAPRTVDVVIAGVPFKAKVKEFKTGSLGFYLSGKMELGIGETETPFQIGMNLTAVGSKELPELGAAAAAA